MKNNIYLIGFMGTGKTTVGKKLAEKLSKDFIDIDTCIEKKIGLSILEIFKEQGELGFRKIESGMLSDVSKKSNSVVGTGGGIIYNIENWQLMRSSGYIITLIATPAIIYERTKDDRKRPLLIKNNGIEEIKRLLYGRAAYYIKGDYILDTSSITIDDATDEIVQFLSGIGF